MEESNKEKSERIMKKFNSFREIKNENFIRKVVNSKTVKKDKYFKIIFKENNNKCHNLNEINKSENPNIFNIKEIFKKRLAEHNKNRKVKLKLTYELIKSGNKNNNIGFLFNSSKDEENQINFIESIKIEINERTPKDIFNIKNFLIETKFFNMLKFSNCNDDIIEKLLINCSINCKYNFLRKDTILYKRNDLIDNFYIIIAGKIGIYKLINKIAYMTGFDYFQYIFSLYINNENYVLGLVLQKNYNTFPIKENMLKYLNINLAHILIQKFKINHNKLFESVEDILRKCFINPENYKYNKKTTKINDFNYELLSNITNLKLVYIYEYSFVQDYNDRNCLESINNEKFIKDYRLSLLENFHKKENKFKFEGKRMFTAKALSDTHLCYFDLNNYYSLLISEYKKIMHRDSKFLTENYILLKKISKQFEEKYFPFFEYIEIKKNHYLFEEDQPFDYIYFLKEGIVELSINKSFLQLHKLLIDIYFIKEKKDNPNAENIINQKDICYLNMEKAYSLNKPEIKLVILEEKDIIGLECFYLGINYFYNAKIIKQGIFYKIKKENFSKIIEVEKGYIFQKKYKEECENKLDFLLNRLFNLNKVKFKLIEHKNIKNEKKKLSEKNKMKIIKKINELFEEKISFENKTKRKNNKFNRTSKIFKHFLSQNKSSKSNENKYFRKISNNFSSQIYNKNQNKTKTKEKNNFYKNEENLKISNYNDNSLQKRKHTDSNLLINFNDDKNNLSENNNSSNSMIKIDLSEESDLFKIQNNPKINLGLKTEKYLLNKIKKQMTNDNLFLNFSKHNISNNNLNNIKLIEKTQIYKNFIKKHSPNKIDFIPWKYFHYNKNKEPLTNRKMNMKNNWYKNLDNLTDNNDYHSFNKWLYGINNNRKKIKLKKIVRNSYSFL